MLNCHTPATVQHKNINHDARESKQKDVTLTLSINDKVYHHPLLACVGSANLFPKFTVTRLCSATVLISNGKAGSELVTGTGVGGGALAAIWL
jgi:hypothetical protein